MPRRRRIIPPEQIHATVEGLSGDDRRFFFAGLSPETAAAYHLWKSKLECEDPEYNTAIAERAAKRMQRVDRMLPPFRFLVYEYGLELVHVFLKHGVRQPRHVSELIEATRERKVGLHDLFRRCGVMEEKSIKYLIDSVLNANIANPNMPGAQPRFAFNKGPNLKSNPINRLAFDKRPTRP